MTEVNALLRAHAGKNFELGIAVAIAMFGQTPMRRLLQLVSVLVGLVKVARGWKNAGFRFNNLGRFRQVSEGTAFKFIPIGVTE